MFSRDVFQMVCTRGNLVGLDGAEVEGRDQSSRFCWKPSSHFLKPTALCLCLNSSEHRSCFVAKVSWTLCDGWRVSCTSWWQFCVCLTHLIHVWTFSPFIPGHLTHLKSELQDFFHIIKCPLTPRHFSYISHDWILKLLTVSDVFQH